MAETDVTLKVGLDSSEVLKETKNMQAQVHKALDSGKDSKFLRSYDTQASRLISKLETLQRKQDKLANTSIAPEGYKEAERTLASLNKQEDRLLERMQIFKANLGEADQGKSSYKLAAEYKQYGTMMQQLEMVQDKIEETRADLKLLEQDFTTGADTPEFTFLGSQIDDVQGKLVSLNAAAAGQLTNFGATFKRLGASLADFGRKYTSWFESIIGKIKQATVAHKEFSSSSQNAGISAKKLFGVLLKYGLGVRSLYFLFRKLRSATVDAFKQLAKESPAVNSQISALSSGLTQLRNSLATAFQPILAAIVPILSTLISWLNSAAAAIANFIAVLTGQSVIYKATKVTNDFAKSLKKAGGAAGGAAKKAKKAFADFDEIHVIDLKQNDSGGGGGEAQFEETEVAASAFAEKVKDIMSQLFNPLKQAWDTVGESVMIAWKFALNEIKALAIAIGQDFLTMWQQDATVRIFENLLWILTDIGLIVGHLARNFREAWQENETGLHILENIRDIIGIIVQHIKDAADYTVIWAANLDFGPLLTSIENFTKNIQPLIDGIAGIIQDFYTQYLLEIVRWVTEEGIPQLLDSFGRLGTEIDWETLRSTLSEVWDNLSKFTENVGQGLIDFIDDMVTGITDLANSQWFQDFLKNVSQALANISPEQVKSIAESFLLLYGAFKLFEGLTVIYTLGKTLGGWGILFAGLALAVAAFVDIWVNGLNDANSILLILGGTIAVIGAVILGIPATVAIVVAGIIAFVALLVIGLARHWQDLKDQVKELWQSIKDYWERVKQNTQELWDAVKEHIMTRVKETKENVVNFFTKMRDKITEIWNFIKTKTVEIWNNLKAWLEEKWNSIKEKARETFESIRDKLKEVWDNVKQKVEDTWNNIKSWVLQLWEDIKKGAIEKFELIRDTVGKIWDTMKEKVTTAWEGMWGGIKDAINNILGGVEKFANGVVDAVNKVIDALNSFVDVDIDVPDWAEDLTGIGDFHIGLDIPNLSHVSIPRLAQGAVLPPNEPFMAMLGDQRSGTNIEAPLDTIKQALVEAMSETSNNSNQPIVLNFTGNLAALARIMKPELDKESARRGISLVVRNGATA